MQLTIKARLILLSVGLVLLPLTLSVFITGNNSLALSSKALDEANRNALVSIRAQKQQQITQFLKTIRSQVETLASNSMIIGATDEFTFAYEDYINEVNNDPATLVEFYQSQFAENYKRLNGDNFDPSSIIPLADTNTSSLQSAYISDNPHPVGNKQDLVYAEDSSTYGKVHEAYHPSLLYYLEEFGYYDIFIVGYDSADVIYSVMKEVDFATNLETGAYNSSGLAKAYQKAKELKSGESYLTKLNPYLPSYDQPTSFVSSPIYDGDTPLGVLIFQIPVQRINKLMMNDQKWLETGLGKTGETYLVGEDNTLRSDRRELIENKARYVNRLKQTSDIGPRVDITNSAIGIDSVKNVAVASALKGKEGYLRYLDVTGQERFSAYTLIDTGNERWALLAEMDVEEAFIAYSEIKADLIWMSILTVIIFVAAGIGIGYLVSKRISDHIINLSVVMDDISKGDGDLTARIEYQGKNEFGDISRSFNEIIRKFHAIISNVRDTSNQVLIQSEAVNKGASSSLASIHSQLDATRNTVTALEQFEASIAEVVRNSNNTQEISNVVNSECQQSSVSAQSASEDILHLMNTLNSTSDVIDDLNKEVGDITSVLDVITSIADQTNLLALNAAIEAARAGEHGRGFSVVAEEVRNLAMRTQESTVQIQQKLETLHKITQGVVTSMQNANSVAENSVERVGTLKATMDSLSEKIREMDANTESVASAINQQSQTISEINRNMLMIEEQSQQADTLAVENGNAAKQLNQIASDINREVEKFKLD